MTGAPETLARVREIARDVLGFAALRPAQQDAAAALAGGRDCLAVLPLSLIHISEPTRPY